jgi:hypothetical protein
MHYKALWSLTKRANRGYRGYPVATVAFYGPDDRRASKVAVGILPAEGAETSALERWSAPDGEDVRRDTGVAAAIEQFIDAHGAKSVVMPEGLLGCPHEEGIDYPEGEVCPQCPFWAHRDRWAGVLGR